MIRSLRSHWPEYLAEALGLGLFMVSAGGFATLLEAPASPLHLALPSAFGRQVLMGLAMGLTLIGLVYSPWGRRSGAHLNPVFTLAFHRLGKVTANDAAWYALFQLAGGLAGVFAVRLALGDAFTAPPVRSVVTVPGPRGTAVAFLAELGISALLMAVVLWVSNHPRLAPRTGLIAGGLVALYITFEAPLSGMSMNPARTFASAVSAGVWTAGWLYLLAPALGMLGAAELYRFWRGESRVLCAKLHHDHSVRCIFRCGYCRHGEERENHVEPAL